MEPQTLAGRRIVLTGGRGRLAGLVASHLSSRGARVTLLSRNAAPPFIGLETLLEGTLLEESDTLLHLAWSTVPFSAERQPGVEFEQDLPLLFRIMQTVASLPDPARLHVVFFSSGGTVYGNARERPSREDDPLFPVGWYGQAKRAAEEVVNAFSRRHGLCTTILRISNPYGFGMPAHKPQGIVPILFRHAREGTPFHLWGDGTARKDFLHHTDFGEALSRIVLARLAGTFNLCRGESHTVNEVIQHVQRVSGRPIEVVRAPARPWDVQDSALDGSRLRDALQWTPRIGLDEGIRLTAETL